MAHTQSVDSLLDMFVASPALNARDLIRALPPARRISCYGLTSDGARQVFPTTQALLRWATRTPEVQAICLDNCVWRSYASFRRNLNQGMPVHLAFDSAELHNWEVQSGNRRRLREARAA